jgi:voltage-gated potassium channel
VISTQQKEVNVMRRRIFEIIEVAREKDVASRIYDIFMILVIVVSIIPLTTTTKNDLTRLIDEVTVCIFIVDYLLRWATADLKLKKGKLSFLLYPFTPLAIIDLLSILPSITSLNSGLRLLKVFRLFRAFRVFRVFKSFRYSKNIRVVLNVFRKQRDSLLVVCSLAVGYILISAIVIFDVEPDTFENFFEAIYWATVSLTTVGYGDIYAVSSVGKIITMVSSLFGIAIVALPAGIITAGYMDELNQNRKKE